MKENTLKYIRRNLHTLLRENLQLADKVYFKTEELSEEEKDMVLSVTNGDNYTKFIADALYHLKVEGFGYGDENLNTLKDIYRYIKEYNKNVVPLIDLDNINKVENMSNVIWGLRQRDRVVKNLRELPSIAIRNLKPEIRKVRTYSEMGSLGSDLEYLNSQLSLISNRSEEVQNKIHQKIFKNGATFKSILSFLDDKENLIGGEDMSREAILQLVNSHEFDMEIIYDQGNTMVIQVEDPHAIKAIGCNSLWCFTYGSGFDMAYRQWSEYSYNSIVYVIVDFTYNPEESEFMHVVVKPIEFDASESDDDYEEDINDEKVFNLMNEPHYSTLNYLDDVLGLETAKQLLTFDY